MTSTSKAEHELHIVQLPKKIREFRAASKKLNFTSVSASRGSGLTYYPQGASIETAVAQHETMQLAEQKCSSEHKCESNEGYIFARVSGKVPLLCDAIFAIKFHKASM